MVSNLVKNNSYYYCSHCMMRQLQINPNCYFCGNYFSNWEEVMIELFKEQEQEEMKNESNFHRRN